MGHDFPYANTQIWHWEIQKKIRIFIGGVIRILGRTLIFSKAMTGSVGQGLGFTQVAESGVQASYDPAIQLMEKTPVLKADGAPSPPHPH